MKNKEQRTVNTSKEEHMIRKGEANKISINFPAFLHVEILF